ncbi:RagB/SusD family nutrient uptake outer membrane protein [Pontibacter qinzhouensis]|uniref:RagB/SusD family nutrient uptake outer membrane protein n=1 Tax=Pontibacter qinzhouensis TaxID=2603253 RepID=A0A5C8JDN7_9BACT|nr:RagB/SusD family nutrient uptake outer membrane protein [Pontibacter qinzhouensis]TXK36525.1 RagB/SusD family nutrient uptake outer membrane protein [Pontibacter qinzhouensis]
MKRITKHILALSTLGLSLCGTTACTELEDTNYSDVVAAQYVPSKDDIGALVGPAYANWRNVLFANGFYFMQEMDADGLAVPAKPYGFTDGGVHRRMHEHTWTSEQVHCQDTWSNAYAGVTNSNRVIYQIESGAIPVEEADKAAVLAELKVLRASYYYVLCDIFGNVPLVTQFDVPNGFVPEQSTREQVYTFIVSEIVSALPHLSENSDVSTYARFNNKWAANALLAKVYLNAQVYTGQAQWDKCIEACDAIINSGKFLLEPNQKDAFKTQNQNSKEIVFAIPFDEVYAQGNSLAAWTMSPQNQFTFNTRYGGWGGLNAIPQFIDTFHPQDRRYTEGWMMGQQYSSSGEPLKCEYGSVKGQPLVYVNECPGIDSTQEIHSFRINKYEIAAGSYANNMSNDFPLIRYADVLMMKAECLLRKGDAAGAATIVSEVRARSFPTNPALAAVTPAQLMEGSSYKYGLKNHLRKTTEGGADIQFGRFLDELGWEFAAEGHRRQDMIRFGIFTRKSWLSHSPNGDTKSIFPIPLQELNKNPKLKQNPGY